MVYLFLFISALAAYFVKGLTGFANTLVMGSLFSFVISNRVTTPVDLLLTIPANIYIVWKEHKSISLKVVLPLSLMLVAGIIPGTLLLKIGNDWVLRSVLGIVIIGIALEMLTRKPVPRAARRNSPVLLAGIGVISGVLAGLYGIGALLVAYISRVTDNKSQFRANICCVFLVDNFLRLYLYWSTGILNTEILLYALFLSPAVVSGMMIGTKIDTHMNEETVKKIIIILLIITGATLFVKNYIYHVS